MYSILVCSRSYFYENETCAKFQAATLFSVQSVVNWCKSERHYTAVVFRLWMTHRSAIQCNKILNLKFASRVLILGTTNSQSASVWIGRRFLQPDRSRRQDIHTSERMRPAVLCRRRSYQWMKRLGLHKDTVISCERDAVMYSVVSVCVFVCVCDSLTSESFDLSVWICRYVFRISKQSWHGKLLLTYWCL